MSREYKFRAWDKEREIMVYPCSIHLQEIEPITNVWENGIETCPPSKGVVIEYELMEWTGLQDKNKKDIYEGDIIKMNGGGEDVIFHVEFEDGCFVARVPWKKENSPELKYYTGFKEEIITVEVIGNIYENKNLLPE